MSIEHEEHGTMFTQDEVNGFNKESRVAKETAEKSMTDLAAEKETLANQVEEMRKTAKLSDEQQIQFEAEREEMRQKGLTSEQKHQENLATLQTNLKNLEVTSKRETGEWKDRFNGELVKNEILKCCDPSENHTAARQSDPIVAMLQPRVTVKEENGKFSPVIEDYPITDSEGKVEKKEVSISQAVDHMFMDDTLKYLFEEKGKPGPGGGENPPGDNLDLSDPDRPPEDGKLYREWREKHKLG